MDNKTFKAWGWAIFSVLVLWGCNNVLIGYSAQILKANYLIYTCSAFVSCAFFLILIGGKGPLVKETLRSIDTWAFGFIMLIGYLLTLSLFSYVSSTEGSLLQRISLIFGVVISWLFLSRTPTKGQLVGALIVMFGIIMVCQDLPSENKGIIYLLMFLEGLALTCRMFIAEIHRPHAQAINLQKDPRAKARVIGFVMFIISTFFLLVTGLLATLQSYNPLPINNNIIPTLNDFRHAPSIFAGLFAGIFFLAPLRMIEFSSANKIKSENFLALAALSSAATYFWEWLLQPVTNMNLKVFTTQDIFAGIIITVGCLVAALSVAIKTKRTSKEEKWKMFLQYAAQNIEQIQDSREIIAATLEHFESNIGKSAKALNLPEEIVEALLLDTEKVLAFKTDVLKTVARNYRKNVAHNDALTGLANRAGFMTALKGAAYETETFSVLYIDLDKFKPINDSYGHTTGDFVLKGIGERLQKQFTKHALATRLGGDEFCVLLLNVTKQEAEKQIKNLKNLIAQPFTYNNENLSVTASIGVATYPIDSQNPEELLKIADKNMYVEKK